MKITEFKLRQIILEEIQMIELEELLVAEAAAMGITLTEEQKKSILQRLGKAAKRYGAGLALGAGLAAGGAGLHGLQTDYAQGIKDQVAQNVAAAQVRNADPAYQASQIKKQLDNSAAFTWTSSTNPNDQTAFPGVERLVSISPADTGQTEWSPANFQAVEVNPGEIIKKGKSVAAVLPPEWSVLKKVLEDLEAGNGPTIDQSQITGATGDARSNRVEFFDGDVWNNASLGQYGASSPYRGALYVTYDSLPDNYAMPLSGKSPSEYYVQLWQDFVGY